jgi:hypothetical protein
MGEGVPQIIRTTPDIGEVHYRFYPLENVLNGIGTHLYAISGNENVFWQALSMLSAYQLVLHKLQPELLSHRNRRLGSQLTADYDMALLQVHIRPAQVYQFTQPHPCAHEGYDDGTIPIGIE